MSLQDLVLGGIKWELAPESAKPIQEKVLSVECRVLNVSDKFKSSIQHSAVPPIPVAPHDELTSAANTAATGADSGDALCAAIREFKHPLSGFANAVMPHFGKDIRLVIITDVPTAEDDASTSIMTGACGELLDKMLGSIDLSRESVSIIPLVFWRTPGNRTPSKEELDLARPFVLQAIKIAYTRTESREPKAGVILTLGALAADEIAGSKLPKDHGTIIELPEDNRFSVFDNSDLASQLSYAKAGCKARCLGRAAKSTKYLANARKINNN